jgi:hypothetical protein
MEENEVHVGFQVSVIDSYKIQDIMLHIIESYRLGGCNIRDDGVDVNNSLVDDALTEDDSESKLQTEWSNVNKAVFL